MPIIYISSKLNNEIKRLKESENRERQLMVIRTLVRIKYVSSPFYSFVIVAQKAPIITLMKSDSPQIELYNT